MSKLTTLAKPTLKAEQALAFAEATQAKASRAFFAPEGHRRLTINLPIETHKRLKYMALDMDCTVTDIINKLVAQEFSKSANHKKS
jgi:macrodomain Ter protein organizer (MatP/YcbG family)